MNGRVEIALFGSFLVQCDGRDVLHRAPRKVQELLACLVLERSRSHSREMLACRLWPESDSTHGRKNLRQVLWQLHSGLLEVGRGRANQLLRVDGSEIALVLDEATQVDVVVLERADQQARGVQGSALDPARAASLTQAQRLYTADLLGDWCTEWCLSARDRYRQMVLTVLDKLVDYHRSRNEYEAAIGFASRALQLDRARERAHRSLMTLLYLSGDRSEALRQFDRCARSMREELDVEPDVETNALRELISSGVGPTAMLSGPPTRGRPSERMATPRDSRSNGALAAAKSR